MTNDHPAVEQHPDWLRVVFGAPKHASDCRFADFHFRWLRHNCDADRHPTTGERIVCSSELPDRLAIRHAAIYDDALLVTWEHDGRTSRFPLDWLREHAYAPDHGAAPAPPADPAPFTLDWGETSADALADQALAVVRARGAVVVRRSGGHSHDPAVAEQETEPLIEAFARAGLRVTATHFGRIEDLRTDNTTNANTDQLGYTDSAVDLHTDQPFLASPPRYQLLQCVRAATSGGENDLVDALAAARYLRSIDREAYERLVTTPVVFHRKQKAFERRQVSPILSGDGESFMVRFSYFTMAPHRLPFDEMSAFYRAHDRFARLVRELSSRIRVALAPGDFVLYDNYRMLHARTAFRGARWMRGIYFDAR